MQSYLRKSIWTKMAAIGFIAIILIGNIWLVYFLSAQSPQPWLQFLLSISLIWTAISACGMGVKMLLHRVMEDRDGDSGL